MALRLPQTMPQLLGHPADENTQILPDSHLHLYDTKQNLWSRTLNKLGVSSWLRKDGEALAGASHMGKRRCCLVNEQCPKTGQIPLGGQLARLFRVYHVP